MLVELPCILRCFPFFIFSPYFNFNDNVISWPIYFCLQDDHSHNVTSGEGFNPLDEKSPEQLQDVLNSSKIFIPLSNPRCRYLLNALNKIIHL